MWVLVGRGNCLRSRSIYLAPTVWPSCVESKENKGRGEGWKQRKGWIGLRQQEVPGALGVVAVTTHFQGKAQRPGRIYQAPCPGVRGRISWWLQLISGCVTWGQGGGKPPSFHLSCITAR